jgi:hypothetical protein
LFTFPPLIAGSKAFGKEELDAGSRVDVFHYARLFACLDII